MPGAAALIQLRAGPLARTKGPPRSAVAMIGDPSPVALHGLQQPCAVNDALGLFIPGFASLDSMRYHVPALLPFT